MKKNDSKSCAMATIIGSPNAGKSTLLNHLIGQKISIITPKVQTTRFVINGIYTNDLSQIIFLDTPGIFYAKNRLEKSMVKAAWSAIAGADFIILIIDANSYISEDTLSILETLRKKKLNVVLLLNKIDIIESKKNIANIYSKLQTYSDIFIKEFMISAKKGDNIEDLLKYLIANSPIVPWLYKEDEITTIPSRLIASEITREQIFLQLKQEIPYETTVETELWKENQDGSVSIYQNIYVIKDSQKKIVLGKNGRLIKNIGILARDSISKILEKKIHLFLFVKIKNDWQERDEFYRYLRIL